MCLMRYVRTHPEFLLDFCCGEKKLLRVMEREVVAATVGIDVDRTKGTRNFQLAPVILYMF